MALIRAANMRVINGNVKPFPIVEIILSSIKLPSPISVSGLRICISRSKIDLGNSALQSSIDIESEAVFRSRVAKLPSIEELHASFC